MRTLTTLLLGVVCARALVAGETGTTERPAGVDAAWWSRAQAAVAASEYEVQGTVAPNRAHGFRTVFRDDGITMLPRRSGDAPWALALTLVGIGRGDAVAAPETPTRFVDGNRVEYRRGDLTEWYLNDPRGLEQGFTLATRPDGDGALRLTLALAGGLVARASADDTAVLLRTDGEGGHVLVLRVDHLVATDAAGVDVPARFEVDGDTLALVVDDQAATYPLVIDPLATSPSWTAEGGQSSAGFGTSVGTAGDVNGDAISDLIIGAPGFDGGLEDEGRVFVFLGSPAGPDSTPTWTADGDQAFGGFGDAVATAGDVNGDGYSDVLVGARRFDGGTIDDGRVALFLGGPNGLAPSPAWTADGGQAEAWFGAAVAPAGDVNGDGFGDVIIGAPSRDETEPDAGRAYVYHGGPSGLPAAPSWTVAGSQSGAAFAGAVAPAGDLDGDGYGDVIVGAPFADDGEFDEGRAYVYRGGPAGLATAAAWSAQGNQLHAWFGTSVATAGDVNGDGYADFVVGAPRITNTQFEEGAAYAYHGGGSSLPTAPSWTFHLGFAGARFGASVATAGDVDADGFADVVVGSPFLSLPQVEEGGAWGFFGGKSGLATFIQWEIESDQPGARLGSAVATAGDVNDDGISDLIIGALSWDGGSLDEGAAFVHFGAADAPSMIEDWSMEGAVPNGWFGDSVASAGDVNGDGFADVIIGAPVRIDLGSEVGRAFVYHGGASGLALTPAWTVTGTDGGDDLGLSVSSAGDVNGDGYADVIVGSPFKNKLVAGRAFVYLGSSAGLSATPTWTGGDGSGNDDFGVSVSAAGDVNGDGFVDVIVGAQRKDSNGAAYVFLGATSGVAAAPSWSTFGGAGNDQYGSSVSAAGDVNGDGFADVIVGAENAPNNSKAGAAYVFHGSASGLAIDKSWTFESDLTNAFLGGESGVSTAGDVNGDGYSDVVVGASRYEFGGGADQGRAWVFHGGPGGLSPVPAWFRDAPDPGGNGYGQGVSTAGDVNGDGCSDVVVGAILDGGAFLYLGSPAGLSTVDSWRATSQTGLYGDAVASAGDVDGDGFADLLVGARTYGTAGSQRGRVFLYHGNGETVGGASPRARTLDHGPIAYRGVAPLEGFRLALSARTPFGRGPVRMQWESLPFGSPFEGVLAPVGSATDWADSGLSGVALDAFAKDIPAGLHHWRARVLYDPASFPYRPAGRWLSNPIHGREEADLRVRKGLARFVPGDRLLGTMEGLGNESAATFDGVEGMKLKLTFPETATHRTALVAIVDAAGQTEAAWTVKLGPKKKVKRKAALKSNGEHTLRILDLAGAGPFQIETERTLPKKALVSTKTRHKDKGKETASFPLVALEGTVLYGAFTPIDGFTGPITLTLVSPAGAPLDVSGYQQSVSGGALKLLGVPLPEAGPYSIEIGGFGPGKAAAVVGVVSPVPPVPGTASIWFF